MGASMERSPFSSRRSAAAAVMDFVHEPMPETVFSVKGSPVSASRAPKERKCTPSSITAMAHPGMR